MNATDNELASPKIGGYSTEAVLGEGGMSMVYLAVQDSLARPVALKVMKRMLTTDADFCKRFLNEGRLIAKLSHPSIVTVYDIGVAEDLHYRSMTYLPGGNSSERRDHTCDGGWSHVIGIQLPAAAAKDAANAIAAKPGRSVDGRAFVGAVRAVQVHSATLPWTS